MTLDEVIEFLKRIDINYQTSLSEDKDIVKEWFIDLKKYQGTDVNESLNNYMKSNYSNVIPKRWAILSSIKTIEEKDRLKTLNTICPFCKNKINMYEYEKHYGRCLDIDFLIRNSEKYLNKKLDKENINKLSKIDLEDKVIKMQKIVYDKTTNKSEKSMIEKYLKNIGIL